MEAFDPQERIIQLSTANMYFVFSLNGNWLTISGATVADESLVSYEIVPVLEPQPGMPPNGLLLIGTPTDAPMESTVTVSFAETSDTVTLRVETPVK